VGCVNFDRMTADSQAEPTLRTPHPVCVRTFRVRTGTAISRAAHLSCGRPQTGGCGKNVAGLDGKQVVERALADRRIDVPGGAEPDGQEVW